MRRLHIFVLWVFATIGVQVALAPVAGIAAKGRAITAPLAMGIACLLLWPVYRDRITMPPWQFAGWVAAWVAAGLLVVWAIP